MFSLVRAAASCFIVMTFSTNFVRAASFGCGEAKSVVEKAICSDRTLSDLDEYLGRYYGGAVETLKDGAPCLKADQRVWVKTVRDACGAKVDCLKDAYVQRLGVLDNLQPGVSHLQSIELPKVPMLITAVPPAADSVPAKPGKPMRVAGQMVCPHPLIWVGNRP